MSSCKRKTADSTTAVNDYEAAVLDFLDKEISASAKSVHGGNTQQEDVDALVSDLLKMAIAATDEQNPHQEVISEEDLNSWFADIFDGHDDGSKPKTHDASPEATRLYGRALKETEMTNRGSAGLRLAGGEPSHEAPALLRAPDPPMPSEIVAEAVTPSGALPLSFGQAPLKSHADSGPPTPTCRTTPVREDADILALASRRPGRTSRMLIAGATFVCVLLVIGAGTHYFSGFTSRSSSMPIVPAAPAGAATVLVATPPPTPPNPRAEAKGLPAQSPNSAAVRITPAAPEAQSRRNNPDSAAAREEIVTSLESPMPFPQSSLAAETTAPIASIDKAMTLKTTDADGSTTNPQPHAPQNDVPPATIIVNHAPLSILGRPAPPNALNLEAIAPASISEAQLSASRRVEQPVLISQVRPVYPEMARRMHLTGTVLLDIRIDGQGKVVKATPLTGSPLLRSAAEDAVMKWRYRPASIDGTTIQSQRQVSIVFNKP